MTAAMAVPVVETAPSIVKPSAPSNRPYRAPSTIAFDPAKHLNYKKPDRIYTMKELGLEDDISPIAVSAPFSLFTMEAVEQLRADVLSSRVLDKYTTPSNLCDFQGREFNTMVAPFVMAAFNHPETLKAISEAAGMELVPIMQLEIGHTNYQLSDKSTDGVYQLTPQPSKPFPPAEKDIKMDDSTVVSIHTDGYPWVTVTMLSDMTNVLGGETAVECGDKSFLKIHAPPVGSTYVMQGGVVRHQACTAFNAPERLTMVTSYRPKNPMIEDKTSIKNWLARMSTRARTNAQYSSYRLKVVSERLRIFAEKIDADRLASDDPEADLDVIEPADLKKFLDAQIEYLNTTVDHMTP